MALIAVMVLIGASFPASPEAMAAEKNLTLFAAASMGEAMTEIASTFRGETQTRIDVAVAASSVLARQIDRGAPASVFVSANSEWMEWLQRRGRLKQETRRSFATTSLVIAINADAENPGFPDLLLQGSRFAMGDPAHVPVGIYARQALETHGLWDRVRGNAVFAENARLAMALAGRGEVGSAIIYEADLVADDRLRVGYKFAPTDHDPIEYQVAATSSAVPDTDTLLDYLAGPEAANILRRHGFSPLAPVPDRID